MLVLGLVPVGATLVVPLLASAEHQVAGVPLFYWSLLACLVLTAACLGSALTVVQGSSQARPGRSGS